MTKAKKSKSTTKQTKSKPAKKGAAKKSVAVKTAPKVGKRPLAAAPKMAKEVIAAVPKRAENVAKSVKSAALSKNGKRVAAAAGAVFAAAAVGLAAKRVASAVAKSDSGKAFAASAKEAMKSAKEKVSSAARGRNGDHVEDQESVDTSASADSQLANDEGSSNGKSNREAVPVRTTDGKKGPTQTPRLGAKGLRSPAMAADDSAGSAPVATKSRKARAAHPEFENNG